VLNVCYFNPAIILHCIKCNNIQPISIFINNVKNRRLVKWKSKQTFDRKLCQKYSYQKLLDSDIPFSITIDNVEMTFYYDTV